MSIAAPARTLASKSAPRGTEPLGVLYEAPAIADGSVRAGLPADLRRAYDGDLAIPLRDDRPTVIANFVETLDGAVALDRDGHSDGGVVSGFSPTDRFVMGLLRAMADVVLVGAGTLRASAGTGWTPARAYPKAAEAYRDLRRRLGLAPEPVTLIVTARGDLAPSHPAFRDPDQVIIIAAPVATALRLRSLGFREGIRVESVGEGDSVASAALVDLAGRLGARVLLTEGGPHVLAGLAAAGLLDELFLTIAPQLVGRDPIAQRLALLEGVALWPDLALWGQFASIRRGGDHLFLRYRFPEEVPVSQRPFVIVGASLTGASAAAQLRKDGFEGPVVLLGDEPHRPYERPPLSKDYLRGASARETLFVHGPSFYDEHAIDLRTSTRVAAIEPGSREVLLGDGVRLGYERLLLATGASARRLEIPGAELSGVHYLRTLHDADTIRDAAAAAKRVVVIGGGWIGAEVSASLRQLGLPVTMIAPGSVPLERVLGPEVGTVYRDLHTEHGVELIMGRRVAAIRGVGAVEAVETSDGARIEADLVVVGVGARPRTQLADDAGLEVEDGIVVDERLETSVPGIFAAGDVAAAWHPSLEARIRLEHWDNAKRQGRAAARNMLGMAEPYVRLPYFYSDQYDLGMEYVGRAPEWDRVVFRGDPAGREFVAFWLGGGRVIAGMNANVWKVNDAIAALIQSRGTVAVERLVDPSVPLDDLEALRTRAGASMG